MSSVTAKRRCGRLKTALFRYLRNDWAGWFFMMGDPEIRARRTYAKILSNYESCRRLQLHKPAMTMIDEDADYGFDQTHYLGSGRRSCGNRRRATPVCSAGGQSSNRQVL